MRSKRLPRPPYNPGVGELVRGKRAGAKPMSLETVKEGFLGWHENGYLPHRDEPGFVQFVTFRLADAFPEALRSEWDALFQVEDDQQRRTKLEDYLDRSRGECHLLRPDIGQLVEDAVRFFHGERYELRAWVVMPNHVHAMFLVTTVPMAQVLESWKSYTAKQANQRLGRRGKFWQEGYWDTFMRDTEHEIRTRRYIEQNPVKARLVRNLKDWTWTSARYRDEYERLVLPARNARGAGVSPAETTE